MSASDALNEALNRFDVPPMSAGLADRIVAAVASQQPAARPAPRRDRRGMWRRGRQVAIGVIAFTTLSAAAVASGLLGRVGIEVPVLTAMLAPRITAPVHKSKPVVAAKLAHKPPVAAPSPPPVVQTVVPPPAFVARQILRAERRERIAEFVQEHPRAAAVIAQRIGKRLRQREAVRREMLGLPPADPAAPDYRPLTPDERLVLRQERRRDFRRFEAILDRRIARRAARDNMVDGVEGASAPSAIPANGSVVPAQ